MRPLLYKAFSFLGESKIRQLAADSVAPREAQLRKLRKILSTNAGAQFGKEHGFSSIKTWEDFSNAVPIRDYEGFRPYVESLMHGATKVLTIETPFMFASTSGTTGESKYIPVTSGYIKEFRAASVVSGYYLLKNFPALSGGIAFSMTSPAEQGRTACGIPYGAISGTLFKKEPFLVKKYISPIPYGAYLIADYESRYYTLLRLALTQPVALFYTLNPSTIMLLCQKLQQYARPLIKDIRDGTTTPPVELDQKTLSAIKHLTRPDKQLADQLEKLLRRDQFTPEHIFPTLQVVSCWTKAAASFYLADFPKFFGDTPICDITYGASEGRGTVFLGPDKQMLAISSHFYEFIPEAEIESEKPTVLLADQLTVGENYFILFTTSAGLYRYNLNDVVKCTGFHNATPLLEFQYKGGATHSFTGEKLTEAQIVEAMRRAMSEGALKARFFTVIPQFRPEPHYEVWIEPTLQSKFASPEQGELVSAGFVFNRDNIALVEELIAKFEYELCRENCEYETKRESLRLGAAKYRLLEPGTYEHLRKQLVQEGTPDSQIKIPHLNPKPYIKECLERALTVGAGIR
jgi:GH3 auxin-responsive promoter.